MNELIYDSLFKKAIEKAKKRDFFIGTGNPNSTILILGKEAAIDIESYPEQHQREIANNYSDWEKNVANNKQFSSVDGWFSIDCQPKYNPLYPYKGQSNTVEGKNKMGIIIRGKGGTSKTWDNYQKIIDSLFNDDNASPIINFHEYSFIS